MFYKHNWSLEKLVVLGFSTKKMLTKYTIKLCKRRRLTSLIILDNFNFKNIAKIQLQVA